MSDSISNREIIFSYIKDYFSRDESMKKVYKLLKKELKKNSIELKPVDNSLEDLLKLKIENSSVNLISDQNKKRVKKEQQKKTKKKKYSDAVLTSTSDNLSVTEIRSKDIKSSSSNHNSQFHNLTFSTANQIEDITKNIDTFDENQSIHVKKSKVIFDDPFLKDNSYKSGNGTWGEEANNKLKFVRGKEFLKNKNKMKKGSYKGGSISLKSSSYKFTY